jgi:hypothetical protein
MMIRQLLAGMVDLFAKFLLRNTYHNFCLNLLEVQLINSSATYG